MELTPRELVCAVEGYSSQKENDYKFLRVAVTVLVNMLSTKPVTPEEVMPFEGEVVKSKKLDFKKDKEKIDRIIREKFGDKKK